MTRHTYMPGDHVHIIGDTSGDVYTVYAVYDARHVTLCLKDYPDIEADYQTDVRDIMPARIARTADTSALSGACLDLNYYKL